MVISVVPEVINSQEIEILDENNIPVSICEKSLFKFNYSRFKNPSFIIDNFEKEKYKEAEIIRIEIPHLEKLGYKLVSIKTTNKIRNFRRQTKSYLIKRKEDPLEGGYSLDRVPSDHRLEMDLTNKRIRIAGRNSYPYVKNECASKWIDIEND
jgi:hypothetical protein